LRCHSTRAALRTARWLHERFRKRQKLHHANEVERLTGYAARRANTGRASRTREPYGVTLTSLQLKRANSAVVATRALVRANTNSITSRIVDWTIMKRVLLCLVVTFCAVSFAHGDPTIRSLQQTLKRQGFYYGAVTSEKSTETTAAIRRYQIRNGLQVTGELDDETLRSVKSSSNSVAAESRPDSKPAVSQPSSGGPESMRASAKARRRRHSRNQIDRRKSISHMRRALINLRRFA